LLFTLHAVKRSNTALDHFWDSSASAKAGRAGEQRQQLLKLLPNIQDILDGLPYMTLITNKERELLLANSALLNQLGIKDGTKLLGLRPGEVLSCEYSTEDFPCSTQERCQSCDLFRTVSLCCRQERPVLGESFLSSVNKGCAASTDLQVSTAPLGKGALAEFILISLLDISSDKRRSALEHTFFHDVLNSASQLIGMIRQLDRERLTQQQHELIERLQEATAHLVDEIKGQRDLISAESDKLAVSLVQLNTRAVLKQARSRVIADHRARNIAIELKEPFVDIPFVSEPVLLQRILSNMLLNACEASASGETVFAGCSSQDGFIEFWVKNSTVMDREVQHKVFERSFSTKGHGRGLGTYGMRLLSRKYLNGDVTFESTPQTGTIFRARYPVSLDSKPLHR
jgi:hypothetical protein